MASPYQNAGMIDLFQDSNSDLMRTITGFNVNGMVDYPHSVILDLRKDLRDIHSASGLEMVAPDLNCWYWCESLRLVLVEVQYLD